ncbi:MAG TPA: hypothetical protein PKC91_00400 [Ignavibacteria bacterium]|nr:hypothetical protein [Ignavibacteria bacterium]
MKIILFTSVFIILIFSEVYSQNSDTSILSKKRNIILKDTSYLCTVITNSRSVYKDVNMFGLKDSTVRFLKEDISVKLNIKEIRTVKFRGAGFMKGAFIGYGIGFVSGFILGGQSFGYSGSFKFGNAMLGGFIIGIPFALIGGGLGSLFAEDKLYDLGKMDLESKRKKLFYIMKDLPDR